MKLFTAFNLNWEKEVKLIKRKKETEEELEWQTVCVTNEIKWTATVQIEWEEWRPNERQTRHKKDRAQLESEMNKLCYTESAT